MNKHIKKILAAAAVLGLSLSARATGPDLTAITDQITDNKEALITAAAIAVGAGLALMAIKFGGRWLVKMFKSYAG